MANGRTRSVAEDIEKVFGKRVGALRKERGWSQADLAERMKSAGFDLHQVSVGRIENSQRPTSVAEVAALGAIFKVNPGDLLIPLPDDMQATELDALRMEYERAVAALKKAEEQARIADQARSDAARHLEEVDQRLSGAMASYARHPSTGIGQELGTIEVVPGDAPVQPPASGRRQTRNTRKLRKTFQGDQKAAERSHRAKKDSGNG